MYKEPFQSYPKFMCINNCSGVIFRWLSSESYPSLGVVLESYAACHLVF